MGGFSGKSGLNFAKGEVAKLSSTVATGDCSLSSLEPQVLSSKSWGASG